MMMLSVLPDLGIGVALAMGFIYVPFFSLIPVIAIETLTLRWLAKRQRALENACIMNVVSTLVGYFSIMVLNAPHLELANVYVESVYPDVDFYLGEPAPAIILSLILGIVATCVLSILIEGGVLMILDYRQTAKLQIPRTSLLRLWGASLVANVASYSTTVALIGLGLKVITKL
ncbi:MAG: hypothetical protein JXA21_16215 [Anaerolineae bacterium]|nr:hypothetical protein [Anaerolineae bacterium]